MAFQDIPIRRKLITIILLISVAVIALTGAAFFTYEFLTFRQATIQQLSTVGGVIAANSTAALAFENQDDAQEILSALQTEQHIAAAALYDARGKLFAKYPADLADGSFPTAPGEPGYHYQHLSLVGFQRVVQDGRNLGTLYLRLDTGGIMRRWLQNSIGIAVIVIMVALAVAYFLSQKLQKQISQPILSLAETAKAISDRGDYSVRATKRGKDELGLLTDAFNQMLSQIQAQDDAIRRDIAERKRAEEALRASEAQLQTIVENLDEGLVVSDLNGHLLQWNRAALELHGYDSSEQDRRCFTELVDTFEISTLEGELLPVEQWPLARILRGEKVHELELRLRRIGSDWDRIFSYRGTLVYDANGKPAMAIVTINDITKRKRGEEMLRASEERYRTLFESNPNPMWVYDRETLAFLAVNAAAVRHYGYSEDEFLAMTIKDVRPSEDVVALMDDLSQKTEGLGEPTQWRHRKKDGELIDVEITSHEQTWLGRRAKLVLVNDITKRKLAEEEIRSLNADLELRVAARTADLQAANKELEAFSYSVSHDLRAPLRAVDGFSQAVLEDYGAQLPEEGRRCLQTIRNGAQRMGNLIDDLLTFSRLSRLPLNKQAVNMAGLAREALHELNGQRNGRQIDVRIGDLPGCEGDPALLKQVWVNLLSNAIKYTQKREAAVVDVGSREEQGKKIYFVCDNGTGFDMQYAHKLFGVFQRLHRADEFEGTGVGLAIVQRIVHRHGGRIWVQAALDRGAEFYFTLEGQMNHD